MGTKHKHYDVIVAWAAGEEIQYLEEGQWLDFTGEWTPAFKMCNQWRIKPKRVKKEGWVNVYRDSFNEERFYLAATKEQANEWASERRLACIRIEWEEEE